MEIPCCRDWLGRLEGDKLRELEMTLFRKIAFDLKQRCPSFFDC